MRVQVHINFGEMTLGKATEGSYPELINVSDTDDVFNTPSMGYKGFQLSPDKHTKVSTLDGTFGLYPKKGYSGVITRKISDANGVFDTPPVIEFFLFGFSFDNLYIIFDQASNEYARLFTLSIDGTDYIINNTSPFCTLDLKNYIFPNITSLHTVAIRITRWSRAFASAKVTYISCAYAEVFPSNSIDNLSCSENALNSQTIVQPGIVEQYADISLYDRYGRLHIAAKEDKLLTNADVRIIAIAEDDTQEVLGTYKVSNWDIETDDSIVQLSATDPSVNFDKIRVEDVPVKYRTVHDMLTLLFGYIDGYSWRYDDYTTQLYCQEITTPNHWFKSDYLDKMFQKVCTLGMLRIYWYNDTFIVMRCW